MFNKAPSLPSNMKHQFSQVPSANIRRSTFNRSHTVKSTFDAGNLIPFYIDEALPGDTFSCKVDAFARLATPIHPIMDNMRMETFFFFVPNRLVWDNWEKFMGAQDDPGDSIDFTIPNVTFASAGSNSVWDYMGIPINVAQDINVLPFRAYNLIWNEWFRDQNLQNSVDVNNASDGPDLATDYNLKKRGKRHDYFTSCLPWPQKFESVTLSLGTSAPIKGLGTIPPSTSWVGSSNTAYESDSTVPTYADYVDLNLRVERKGATNYPDMRADLTNATAVSVNDLRQAVAVQQLNEIYARGGSRYTEVIKSHFNVDSPDARLQRPEYLGGGSSAVNVSSVPQTSSTDATTPQGNLSAYGTALVHNHGFVKSFTEHGYVIGLVNVRADLTYQKGLDKLWMRETKNDFYWPTLSSIGEQAVLSKEIYMDGTSNDDDVFGYQERYAEYRYKNSMITGLFRSAATGTLDPWHLSQNFSTRPVLGTTFIEDDPPIDRAIAVPTEPHFLFDAYVQLKAARPMPVYSTPGLAKL